MAQKRPHDHDDNSHQFTFRDQPVYRSNPIHDRSSTFTAIFSSSSVFLSSPRILQQYTDFKDASHRILAWRRRSKQLSLGFGGGEATSPSSQGNTNSNVNARFETGSDEDGEKYAGRKLEALLERMSVEGVIVVARWYGGVMLGPVRFKWIEDCAGEAVRFSGVQDRPQHFEPKRVKTDGLDDGSNGSQSAAPNDTEEKQRLSRILEQRDGSIDVLRSLLATRKKTLEELQQAEASTDRSADIAIGKDVSGEDSEHRPGTEEYAQQTKDENLGLEKAQSTGKEGNTDSKAADTSKTVQPNYTAMPLQRLKQLEKARDATLSWILKQIDNAEEEIRCQEGIGHEKVKAKAEDIARYGKEGEQSVPKDLGLEENNNIES